MSILRWLGLADSADQAPVDSLREIEKSLTDMEPAQARYIAGFAYILGRVAKADHQVTDDESAIMRRLVAERGNLSVDQASLVVRIATAETLRHGGTEDFIVTREFEKSATREQKLALLRCLYRVSAADGSVSSAEDHVVRQIADELGLDHADYIEARAQHRHRLAVLRKPDDAG